MDPLAQQSLHAGWGSPTEPIHPQPPSSASSSASYFTQSATPTSERSQEANISREPKIFGLPSPSLVSPLPRESGSGSGLQPKRSPPHLRVRISGLERNRKDLLVRFDASTNLPNFRTSLYRNIQRSYIDFQKFQEQLAAGNPQTIVPALPLPQTSAPTDEEDDRLVRLALQKWFSRVCENTILHRDDELRSFIESDFGYAPVPSAANRRITSSSSSATSKFAPSTLTKVFKRGPPDEDEELQAARGILERLEERWGAAAQMVGSSGKARRAVGTAQLDTGAKLIGLATVEPDPQLALALRKMGRVWENTAAIAHSQAVSENVILSDSLGYQALNARAAKDTLAHRTQILEDAQNASKAAITKRRNVERLKGSSNISSIKVDDAIEDMQEAVSLEKTLASRVDNISANLHVALRAHSRATHDDVAIALLEHARTSILGHRQMLKELEALKPDLARIGNPNAAPAAAVRSPPSQTQYQSSNGYNGVSSGSSRPPQASMTPSQPYYDPRPPPPANAASYHDGSRSMFLPGPAQQQSGQQVGVPRSQSSEFRPGPVDPLGGHPTGMAQSMMLPGQRAQPASGRGGARKLDERMAAKLLAGGF